VQRYRLFKQLALSYALKFVGRWMIEQFQNISEEGILENTENLPELAATSGGLKAFSTFLVAEGIEDCRKCCGGHGYLLASGVAALSADYVWQTTAEGDYTVLILQTARFLLRSFIKAQQGTPFPSGPMQYFSVLTEKNFRLETARPPAIRTVDELLNPKYLHALFQFRALAAVLSLGAAKKDGLNFDEAFSANSLQARDAVKAHCFAFLVSMFAAELAKVNDETLAKPLSSLLAMLCLSNILDDNWAPYGVVDVKLMALVRRAIVRVMDDIRPNCVALVDAFDFPDRVLNSVLGNYDGNVYEAIMEHSIRSSLNRTDPFDGYNEHIRPLLDMNLIRHGNKSHATLPSSL